ncbi:ATP-grasp domain-containing protein [Bacillus sp. ISL-40]|uniref:ATP-grasp domain-containing protein n=1 Tax=unclassified Bacillus (in: firmicutes) TaxID=185979 RepID=UPI001BE77174|nr:MULTISPECIES: ATP-grasp domain-containing protein [unclassified Bacillus (in: firmicutes)]MBT2699940.1 ATP-grasp domain-containing protein [Bacillus sp. ISL-40]MBT2743755.1 ATP-grasp domain-containing protein [Bacillus sp. ISL-77]
MKKNKGKITALLGWSLHAIEAIDKMNRPYVVVGPPEFQGFADTHDIQFIPWVFDNLDERSDDLYEKLKDLNTKVAVPIYEETVEWAGALNARLQNNTRIFQKSLLLRDKGLMKRKAQMAGIRVGVFAEAENKDDIYRFLNRVNEALIKLDGDMNDPIHVKPFNKAGTVGHRLIRDRQDIEQISESEFPLLMESHLDGQEFSCEAFIHGGKVRFLNITEYVKLGHSNFVPASPSLEEWRPQIKEAIEKLVDAFEIKYGVIHPEYFIAPDGTLNFGEVAARVPGGHIFELIEKAYGFSAFQAQVLCSDPDTTEEELEAFFPEEVVSAKGYAGSLMVYPNVKIIERLNMPEELKNHPYFERHDMFIPVTSKVAERVGFGNHYGTIFFSGNDSEVMRTLMKQYEKYDFYL